MDLPFCCKCYLPPFLPPSQAGTEWQESEAGLQMEDVSVRGWLCVCHFYFRLLVKEREGEREKGTNQEAQSCFSDGQWQIRKPR